MFFIFVKEMVYKNCFLVVFFKEIKIDDFFFIKINFNYRNNKKLIKR